MTIDIKTRERIVSHLFSVGLSEEAFGDCTKVHGVSINSVKTFWNQLETTGSVAPKRKRNRVEYHGSVSPEDFLFALDLLQQAPDLYISELCQAIMRVKGNYYTTEQVSYSLIKAGYSRKV
jgi:hypothetical protein